EWVQAGRAFGGRAKMTTPGGQECPMPLRFCRVHVLHRLGGGQPCCRPAFRPAGPAEKRVRRLKSLPHGSDTTGLVGLRGCVASKKNRRRRPAAVHTKKSGSK